MGFFTQLGKGGSNLQSPLHTPSVDIEISKHKRKHYRFFIRKMYWQTGFPLVGPALNIRMIHRPQGPNIILSRDYKTLTWSLPLSYRQH